MLVLAMGASCWGGSFYANFVESPLTRMDALPASVEMTVWSSLSSTLRDVPCHTDSLAYIKPTLHPRDRSHLDLIQP